VASRKILKPKEKPLKKPRVRRDPAEARELILSAAERVFAAVGPDVAGLAAVAEEAGVSHALVTHYFGTYGNLVEETFARRVLALREAVTRELLAADSVSPRVLLRAIARALMEPASMRLVSWALVSGRAAASDFVVARLQGLRMISDALEARLVQFHREVDRPRIEFVVLLTVTTLHGYAFGRAALQNALGHEPSAAADEDFIDRLAELVEGYLLAGARVSAS
jgi:AcrR family transcriptional regulator